MIQPDTWGNERYPALPGEVSISSMTRPPPLPGECENSPKNDRITIIVLGIIIAIVTLFMIILCICCIKNKNKKEELQTRLEEFQQAFEELQTRLGKSEQGRERLQQELERLQQQLGQSEQKRERLQQQLGKLQIEIDTRKAQYKSVWMKVPLYPDWRKEEFKAVNVTLDAATAHPSLFLSEKGRRVTWQETCQDLLSSTKGFDSLPCVLGQLNISMGRAFWEVEVGNTHSWDLGICRDNVKRKGSVTMSPQNGFWAIRLYDGEYWALTSPETQLILGEKPNKVGIFLDYEAGEVCFYNMTDGSHIFSFPHNTFSGVLRPLFRLWSSDSGSLTICPGKEELTDVPNHIGAQ